MPEFLAQIPPTDKLVETYAVPWALNLLFALLIFIGGRIAISIVLGGTRSVLKRAKTATILQDFIISILKALLTLVLIIVILRKLGVDTTSLVALIGAAGLAVGLALQSSLSNFAAGVMLIMFRPFKEGDYVSVAGQEGVVEKIQLFSSTFRSIDNKELTIPNSQIYGDVIVNYSARSTRRVDMTFGIGYDDDLRKAKQILTDMVANDDRVLADPAPQVAVSELGDNSVNFVVRPWVKAADYWNLYFDFMENVKLKFDAEGISIPYPQMDVHVDQRASA